MKTLPYLEFCLAQSSQADTESLREQAKQQWLLQERILSTELARQFSITTGDTDEALNSIAARYSDQTSFLNDLSKNRLDEAILKLALKRQLWVDAVLKAVCAQIPPVSREEAMHFYLTHQERFFQPEARCARHILITINDELPESTRTVVEARLDGIGRFLAENPDQFGAQALRYSECPTALQGGELGWVKKGQLYPELESALFDMKAQEIRLAESPLGLHLLSCEALRSAGVAAFEAICDKLLASLQSMREKKAQRAWLKALPDA